MKFINAQQTFQDNQCMKIIYFKIKFVFELSIFKNINRNVMCNG